MNLNPQIYNFRFQTGQPTRIYFDSTKIITATTFTGFEIEGETVIGINISPGLLTGHYLTLGTQQYYWSQILTRYEGGSDIQDLDGNIVFPFTIRITSNLITEPATEVNRYAALTGVPGATGTKVDPWTIEEAYTNAIAGDTVWVKAGNYGNINITVANDGLIDTPIKFIGYGTVEGDAPKLDFQALYDAGINNAFDPNVMPLLTGLTTGIVCTKLYVIMKNIQVYNLTHVNGSLEECFALSGSWHNVYENCYSDGGDFGMRQYGKNDENGNTLFKGCYTANATTAVLRGSNANNLMFIFLILYCL
jgi:hypothetical protein